MTYNEWRDELKNNLLTVTDAERRRVLDYYAEAYADRREAGFSEREIIEGFGAPYDAAQRILAENTDDYYRQEPGSFKARQDTDKTNYTSYDETSTVHEQRRKQHQQRSGGNGGAKTAIKVVLIVLAVLVCISLISVILFGFVTAWSFQKIQWEDRVYESEIGEEITCIDLDFSAGTLEIQFYDGESIKVEYAESQQITTECEVVDTTLEINSIVHWHVQFLWFNKIPTTKVYIPQNMQLGLKLNVEAGVITINEGTFANVNIKMEAGTLKMDSVECNDFVVDMDAGAININKLICNKFVADIDAGALNVKGLQCGDIGLDLSAGSANLKIAGKKSDYTITADVSAGSCNVRNQNGTTSKKVQVDVSAGSANITFEE